VQDVKLVIPSSGRSNLVERTLALGREMGFDPILVVREDEAKDYEHLSPVVAPVGPGVTVIRRWVMRNLIRVGEWYLQMDDLVESFRGPAKAHYDRHEYCNVESPRIAQRTFDEGLSPREVRRRLEVDVEVAEQRGAEHVAFAPVDNYYFRGKKYRNVGYCLGRVVLTRKSLAAEYEPEVATAMDDFQFTASQLLATGRVLIDNWILPVKKHYQPGGIGTYAERLPQKIADCRRLMARYPGLFAYRVKSGCHPKAELRVRFNSTRQVDEWRRSLSTRT